MLDLDTAIKHCLEVAEQEECFINYPHSDIVLDDLNIESRKRFAAEHRQLAEWLTELKELKALVAGYNPLDIQTLEMLLAMMRNQNNNDTNLCELCDKEVELKEAKRLLKAAVEDFELIAEVKDCSVIDISKYKWRYADEALVLIGEDGEQNG